MRQGLLIATIIACFSLALGEGPTQAAPFSRASTRAFDLTMFSLGTMGFSTLAWYIYKNSPRERAKGYAENLGLGEYYLSADMGLSYLPAADWTVSHTQKGPFINGRTAKNVVYDPGIQGGLKFGRFFDEHPWFGLELETSLSNNTIHGGRFSPPLPLGQTRLFPVSDRFLNWTMQVNLMFRYGFFKDKEVTFGRLQPYVGLGPGFEIMYAKLDSAKNFAIETQAGLKYMLTEKIAIFGEYKFSYQYDVEYQDLLIGKTSPGSSATMNFDVTHHRFVLGISYHFKNLYGN